MIKLNINEIMNYLPHRYPFLLVDKVIAADPGKTITAVKNVSINEWFLPGHFPQQPIMPGVLTIEALAQAAGILYFLTSETKLDSNNWFFLAGVNNARFKRVVIPGDQLLLDVTMIRNKRDLWIFNGKATVEGELACEAELLIARGALK
jgi:3-hydroxyacyl-[acyl-carrier-protein] dehydratase